MRRGIVTMNPALEFIDKYTQICTTNFGRNLSLYKKDGNKITLIKEMDCPITKELGANCWKTTISLYRFKKLYTHIGEI